MQIVLIACDIRSTYNIGSIMRTADGLGIKQIYAVGVTPYLEATPDERLPHAKQKSLRQIQKTALGAEENVRLTFHPDTKTLIEQLKDEGFKVAALEQSKSSKPLKDFTKTEKLVLILGNEVSGLDAQVLSLCDEHLEIPMLGTKESFNVSVAAAVAMYELRRAELY